MFALTRIQEISAPSGPAILSTFEGDRTRPLDEPPLFPAMLQSGYVIPHTSLRVDGPCGEGGSGTVYRAVALASDLEFAVKVPRVDYSPVESFIREAKLVCSFSSPHIVRFVDMGILPDARPWFAMEYLAGPSLGHIVARQRRVDPQRVVRWLRQACRGLSVIHAAGWVHRDIKPSNLVLTDDTSLGRLQIIDLGIAERIGSSPVELSGTPNYIAPEQARGCPASPSSDIYALGCTAYELVTRHRIVPCSIDSDAKIKAHIEGIDLRWPDDPALPPALRALIERCVARDPEDRPPCAETLERQLADVERQLTA